MTNGTGTSLAELSNFLIRLDEFNIHYQMTSVRDGAVMVQVAVPGERWEIEFFAEDAPAIEIFRSSGEICDSGSLDRLFANYAD